MKIHHFSKGLSIHWPGVDLSLYGAPSNTHTHTHRGTTLITHRFITSSRAARNLLFFVVDMVAMLYEYVYNSISLYTSICEHVSLGKTKPNNPYTWYYSIQHAYSCLECLIFQRTHTHTHTPSFDSTHLVNQSSPVANRLKEYLLPLTHSVEKS